MTIYDVIR